MGRSYGQDGIPAEETERQMSESTRIPHTPGARQAKDEIPTDEQRCDLCGEPIRFSSEATEIFHGKTSIRSDCRHHIKTVVTSPLPAEGVALPEPPDRPDQHSVETETWDTRRSYTIEYVCADEFKAYADAMEKIVSASLSESAALRKQLEEAKARVNEMGQINQQLSALVDEACTAGEKDRDRANAAEAKLKETL